MAFKGKPSITKRNRELALRERQQAKAVRRDQRSREVKTAESTGPVLDPVTGQPLSADEIEYREFQAALKEQRAALEAENEAAEAARQK